MAAERALVTGGAGFVGLHLARRLLAEGTEVVLLDDLSRGRRDAELEALLGHVRLVEHDLRQPLPDGLLPTRFDAVYHLAAVVGVRHAMEDPYHVLRTNVLATLNVVDWCARARPGAVFLSSTSEVADAAVALGLRTVPVSEEAPFAIADARQARSSYALSKMACESALLHAPGLSRVRIGRFFNVYGPRMGSAHVIPELIGRILDRMDPMPLHGAHQSRAFCYIDDAVEAVLRLMRAGSDDAIVANIGNDREEVQVLALANRLFDIAGWRPAVQIVDTPAGSPDRRCPALGLIRELTGYEPRHPLDVGLRRTFDWYAHARNANGP